MLKRIGKPAVRYFLLALVSVLFLLVFSAATSSLTVCYGNDSAFFILVGQGMAKGLMPYRDFFDMKGPYLFLLEYIGQLICPGRTGAFIIQCVNLFLCLCIIDKIYHRKKATGSFLLWMKDCIFYILPCLYMFCHTMQGGNLTEELSLPLLLAAVYFVLKYFDAANEDHDAEHPLKYGLFYGTAFGILALIRVTNAAFIGAVLATVSLDLLLRGKFRNLLLNGAMFILGCVLAFAPMCLYYWSQGLLGEMFSQVFLFGVQYSVEVSFLFKLFSLLSSQRRILIIMTLPLVVAALCRIKDWKYWVLSAASYLLLMVACAMGNGYLHYLTLGIPHLVLGFAGLKEWCGQKKGVKIPLIVSLLLFLLIAENVFWTTYNCRSELLNPQPSTESHQRVLEIRDAIPEDERNSVYVYGLHSCSNWYLQADILPYNRYCDWQEHYIALNPEIGDEILQCLEQTPPQWIVTDAGTPVDQYHIADVITSNYDVYMSNEAYTLYCLTD